MPTATSGLIPYKQLEKEYAKFVGSQFAVSVNTGTAALHLGLLALGIGQGDEVITADFSMGACGFAISYVGATPVFVDCLDDLTIDTTKIEAKISPKTKAIMPVHIYGRLCDMEAVRRIADKHNLLVLEDACEAQGAVKNSLADITVFSFFRNKIIHAEEGGIATTNKKEWADRMNYLKNMAFDEGHTYFHKDIGFNYRMPDSTAKQALQSLANYEKNAAKRRRIEYWYNQYIPLAYHMPARKAVWVYDLMHPKRDEAVKKVVGSRFFFKPLSTMPMWKQETGLKALEYSAKGMYLPVYPHMTKRDVITICKLLCKI